MRTVADTAPRCRGPAHDYRGTGCDRFDQETLAIGGEVPARSEAGEWGASFTFAATVGSLWRATPQTGQRLRCAEFSWYGPSAFRQLQCHSPGFSLTRRLGWTLELNTIKRSVYR
jgi:hypothetical protein